MVFFTDKVTKWGKYKKRIPRRVAGDKSDLSYSLIQVKPKPYHQQN
jgi:hypothetical protein